MMCKLKIHIVDGVEVYYKLAVDNLLASQAKEIVELKAELLESKGLSLSLLVTNEEAVGLLKHYRDGSIDIVIDRQADDFLSKQEKKPSDSGISKGGEK